MTAGTHWTIELSHEVEQVFLDSLKPRSRVVRLAARLRHALDLLELNGPGATGAKKLNDLDIYQIRVDDHRLYFGIVPGSRTLAATVFAPKTTGHFPMKTYQAYQKRVQDHVISLMPNSAQQPTRRQRT